MPPGDFLERARRGAAVAPPAEADDFLSRARRGAATLTAEPPGPDLTSAPARASDAYGRVGGSPAVEAATDAYAVRQANEAEGQVEVEPGVAAPSSITDPREARAVLARHGEDQDRRHEEFLKREGGHLRAGAAMEAFAGWVPGVKDPPPFLARSMEEASQRGPAIQRLGVQAAGLAGSLPTLIPAVRGAGALLRVARAPAAVARAGALPLGMAAHAAATTPGGWEERTEAGLRGAAFGGGAQFAGAALRAALAKVPPAILAKVPKRVLNGMVESGAFAAGGQIAGTGDAETDAALGFIMGALHGKPTLFTKGGEALRGSEAPRPSPPAAEAPRPVEAARPPSTEVGAASVEGRAAPAPSGFGGSGRAAPVTETARSTLPEAPPKQPWEIREERIEQRVAENAATGRLETLDRAPWGVEYLRGKTITSLRDGSSGVIETVDTRGTAHVRWLDTESSESNSGSPEVRKVGRGKNRRDVEVLTGVVMRGDGEWVLAERGRVHEAFPDVGLPASRFVAAARRGAETAIGDPEPDPHATVLGDVGNARLPLSMVPTTKGDPIGHHKVIEALSKVVTAPIRAGRMGNVKARGLFKVDPEVIRVKEAGNIPTAAHEVGHALSKSTGALAGIDKPVRADLLRLGRDLYGNKRPHGGYAEEGFAELIRLWTTDPAALKAKAPAAAAWFDGTFLKSNQEAKASLEVARGASAQYAGQGAESRAGADMEWGSTRDGALRRALDFIGPKNMVEEFKPLATFSKIVSEAAGPITAERDPYKIATAVRLSTPGVVRGWVEGQGMTDLAGNVKGPSLDVAVAPAVKKGGLRKFSAYLWARHALDMHAAGKNPGMAEADARHLVETLGSPEFQIAAQNVYGWRKGVIEYGVEAGLFTPAQAGKILQKWAHSVPLMRVFDELPKGILARHGQGAGAPIKRLKGSGRRVRALFDTIQEQAVRVVDASNKARVLRAMVEHVDVEGIGRVIEEVPKDRVPTTVEIERLKSELEAAGADLSAVDLSQQITYFTEARLPHGKDPVLPMTVDGKTKWYQVSADLWASLEGLDVYRLPKALDVTFGALKRMLTLGTTGLRPAFGLVRNPIRDLPTFLMQTRGSPFTAAASYARAMADVAKAKTGAGASPYHDLFVRLGANMSQPLTADSAAVRKVSRGLGKGGVMKTVRAPIEALRDLIQIGESIPRVAEVMETAKRVGWDGKSPLTERQALEIAIDSKQVTTDFTAAGRVMRVVNQIVPFSNAAVQGARRMAFQLRNNPVGATIRGFTLLTAPTLALWWKNKDEDWYLDMPWQEKFAHWYVPDGDNLLRVPRPFDWGNVFATLPEAIADGAYREDPKGFTQAFGKTLDDMIPDFLGNPLVRVPKEQLQNRVDHTGAPIVPMSQEDMPAEEQVGPQTTRFAKGVGGLLGASPRRIDHAVGGVFGGLGRDVLDIAGVGSAPRDRESERADVPVIGTVWRRGGKEGHGSQAVDDLFDALGASRERAASIENPETDEEKARRSVLEDARKAIGYLQKVQSSTRGLTDRQMIQREIRDVAREAMSDVPAWKIRERMFQAQARAQQAGLSTASTK